MNTNKAKGNEQVSISIDFFTYTVINYMSHDGE